MENEVKTTETSSTSAQSASSLENATTTAAQAEQATAKGKFTSFLETLFGGEPVPGALKDDAATAKTESKAGTKSGKAEVDFEQKLAEARKQWEAEAAEKARLENLPDADKAKAESEAQKAELAAVKQQLAERELKAEAVAYLEKEGYPIGLADMLNYTSSETKDKTLEKAISVFEKAFEGAAKERLRGKTPVGLSGAKGSASQLQDQIAKNIRGGIN